MKSYIDSQNVKFDERSHQVTIAKWEQRLWESEDLQNTNLSICESKNGEKFMG